jgi:diacylglycerol O-acyltransferase / wax synthase
MDRMSAQDAMFLYVEDPRNPMHVGSVAILEGPAPRYGDLVRMVVRKLHLVPRYRQRVRFVPFEAGRPVWADDPYFQVLYHVRHTAVPPPGGDDELRNLAGRLLAQTLDRHKPLWELWMVEGLRDGRWAVVSKTHHCMVDGVAGTDLLSVMFDRSPHPRPLPDVPWAPEREVGDLRLLADAWIDGLLDPLERLGTLPPMLRAPFAHPRQAYDLVSGWAAGWLRPRRVPASLNGPVGPHRRWSWVKGSLDEVGEIRRALGGTVNDVVLAAIARAFRELLISRGEPVEGHRVRTLVPVSTRADDEHGLLNNRVSGLFPDLPVGIADPLERLADIQAQMASLKRSRQAEVGDALVALADFAPALWLAVGGRIGVRTPQRLVQTVTTNVPGPRTPLYVAGRRLLDCYPYVPIGGSMRVGIAIFSYAGELNFGATGDYDSVPDLGVLCAGIEKGMSELLAAARRRSRRRKSRDVRERAGTVVGLPTGPAQRLVQRPGGNDGLQLQRHPPAVRRPSP